MNFSSLNLYWSCPKLYATNDCSCMTHIYAVHPSQQLTVCMWTVPQHNVVNKYTLKTTLTAMLRSLPYSMFNVFLHLHVHRWTSIGEKICLWICLTLLECNCFLIWAQGQTSVHSAAVRRTTAFNTIYTAVSLTHNYFIQWRRNATYYRANCQSNNHVPLFNFLRLYSHFQECQ